MRINTIRWAWGIGFILASGPMLLGMAGCGNGEPALDVDRGEATSAEDVDSASSAAKVKGLSIVAWNMEHFPLVPNTPALVEDLLEEIHPDLVGVQEIEDDAAFLAMVGSVPGHAAVIADDPDNYTRVGVIYRKSRVSISEVETLFDDDSYAFPRPPLKVHVSVKGTDLDFDFVAVHLKAMGDPASQKRRKAACRTLARWIEERVQDGHDPDVVVAGDWNDEITDAPDQNVFSDLLDAPDRFRFLTEEVAQAGDHSYIPINSLIDHVLVTTPLLDAYGEGSTEAMHLEDAVKGYVKNVSDHRPIRARFALP